MHEPIDPLVIARRHFFGRAAAGLGGMAVASLLPQLSGTASANAAAASPLPGAGGVLQAPHLSPKAKRIIYLCQSGVPSHLDLFDYKPQLNAAHGEQLPDSVRRDHHPRCFTIWMASGGVKRGHVHGLPDEYCYNIADGAVYVHDLNATILHLMGIDHERLAFKHQGRRFRLTDVHGHVVKDLLN